MNCAVFSMLYSSTSVLYQETYPALLRPWYKHFLKLWCLCPASPSLFFEAFSLPDSPFLHFQQVSWSLDLSESRMVQTLRSRCEETLSGLLGERVLFTGFGMCRHEAWSCLRHPAATRLMTLSRKQMWGLERNGPQGHLPAELDLKSTPGLPVLQAFLLFLWLQAWVGFSAVKTLSDHIYSILRFLKQQRNFALSEAEFSLQAVHPVTGPRTWEAGPEGLGMSCFRNRRPGGMKVALRCSDIMGDRKAVCSSWFQIVSELEPTCAMWTKTTFSQLERKKDCFTLWAAQQWKQLMPCST